MVRRVRTASDLLRDHDVKADSRTDIAHAWRGSANPGGSRSAHLQTRGAHRIPAGAAIRPRVSFRNNGRVVRSEEARRRERRQYWFKTSRDYHFEPEA